MKAADQYLLAGLVRLHILHHAVEEPIFGLGIIAELANHGYVLSAGTLYPLLHGLEERGFLRSTVEREGKRRRRVYRATVQGTRALGVAKDKVRELFGELFEKEPRLARRTGRAKAGSSKGSAKTFR